MTSQFLTQYPVLDDQRLMSIMATPFRDRL
jgi:hypothetical protein